MATTDIGSSQAPARQSANSRLDEATAPIQQASGGSEETDDSPATSAGRKALVQQHARGLHVDDPRYSSLLPLMLPTPREIEQPLAYLRALRPLRLAKPARQRRQLDEAATARRSAEIKRPFPVWRPESERFFDLLILVDHGPSMLLWKRLAAELRSALYPLAAFGTVRVESLAAQSASTLFTSRGDLERLVVLVVSDCVGSEWHDGRPQQMLATWGSRSPVAVLNPLPRRLWNRTAVGASDVVLRAHRRAQPNRDLRTVRSDPSWKTDATRGVPVPLIGLHADDVAAWAGLVSGRAEYGAWVTVLADGEATGASAGTTGAASAVQLSPTEAVTEFSRCASPAAFKLAGMLATAPLTLPTMRAVQYLTEQKFGSAHIAEVFLSGLIERIDPEHDFFDFAPGVRTTLLGTIRRSDAAWLISRLDEWINRNMRIQPYSFTAFIESSHGEADTISPTELMPFATIPRPVLQRIGGGYAPPEPPTGEIWEGKLLVLGEGAAGKTSLIKRLAGEPFDRNEALTHGLHVLKVSVPHPERPDTQIVLRTWDFGGQQIYHATHQFFLTDESLCLLVWNSRIGWEQGRLRYWLRLIEARIPNSPIVIVATHASDSPVDLPVDELRRDHPRIAGIASVDNMTEAGIASLREMIAAAAAMLPLMGNRWPNSWLNAARAVEDMASRLEYVTPARLWHTMAEAGLEDHESKLQLARAMHASGAILYFADDLELAEIAILRPAWLAQHIAMVLDDEQVATEQGLLRRSRLRELWGDLDPGLREHFLNLMDRFDLAYRVAGEYGDDVISLVVERLPWNPPANWVELWDQRPPGETDQQLRVIYQLSTATPGIPSWFIARSRRFSTGTHWRNGAVLAHPDGLHRGLVRADMERDSIELTVRGPAPATFFAILNDMFDQTLERYPGLSIRRMIPCPCQVDCSHLYDYSMLQSRIARTPPREYIECPNSLRDVYVPQLLFSLSSRSHGEVRTTLDRLEQQLQQLRNSTGVSCPRVFTVTEMKSSPIRGTTYQVTLYCEEPGAMHPLPGDAGKYRLRRRPPGWLQQMAPLMKALVSTLTGTSSNDSQLTSDLAKMRALIEDIAPSVQPSSEANIRTEADLRAFARVLDEIDPTRNWGGLSKVLMPEGQTLYVCPEHAATYLPPRLRS